MSTDADPPAPRPNLGGRVHAVCLSDGGVPKLPVPDAVVGPRGLVGDRQANTKLHGRVWQALCLWSLEVIEALRAEGHPVAAGSTGENLTLVGLDWPRVVPGVRLGIGGAVVAEITAYTAPCVKNAAWFLDRDVNRMSQEHHPGWSRVYASVVQGGTVRPGDAVTVLG